MQEIGFVKIHRQIRDNILFQEKRVFSKFEVWMDILMSCNFKEGEFLLGYDIVNISPGEFVSSKVKLRQKYGRGEQKLNNFFNLLEKQEMLTIKTVGKARDKASLVRVTKWAEYQYDQGTNQDSNQGTTGGTSKVRPSAIEEGKESKEGKEEEQPKGSDTPKKIKEREFKKELKEESIRFMAHWNTIFKTDHTATPDFINAYITARKKYANTDVAKGLNAYKEKNTDNIHDIDWKKKYYLTPLKFISQKKNGFISHL